MNNLILIPSFLGDQNYDTHFPANNLEIADKVKTFFVEDLRTARRFLSAIKVSTPIHDLVFEQFDKKTTRQEALQLFKKYKGQDIGVISEAGCPGIADPGALAVEIANELRMTIQPLVGPSSITLALMGSGLNGQSFEFIGYIPVKKPDRVKKIKLIDAESSSTRSTKIFIETPYRNEHLFDDLIKHLHPETKLCVGVGLLSKEQHIQTLKVKDWVKTKKPVMAKIPTIFLILGQ